jgi:tRNA(Ile)-lysidine synthase
VRQTNVTPLDAAVADVLRGHSSVVLAVSGGIDSMTLFDVAARLVGAGRLMVATFDHGTGSAATAAAALVERRAGELGVECVVGHATSTLVSEADFRAARWAFLRDVAAERSARVATAHTDDDQIETVLMRIMRGTGARGLAALAASSDVLRPMLRTTRRDIAAYAATNGLVWVEDPTNRMRTYFRNRVRADLLPALRRADPAIDETLRAIGESAATWRDEVARLCDQIDQVRLLAGAAGIRVPAAAVSDESSARIIWPELAGRAGVVLDRRGIERLAAFAAESHVGARMQLSGGWHVTRGRRELVVSKSSAEGATAGPFALSDGTRFGEWTFHTEPDSTLTSFRDPWSAWLPADAPLLVRPWRAGDAMTFGNGGSRRKVKHLLSAAGVTGHERAGWPVVLSGDVIVWIPGVRRSDAATARPGRPGLAFVCEYDNR